MRQPPSLPAVHRGVHLLPALVAIACGGASTVAGAAASTGTAGASPASATSSPAADTTTAAAAGTSASTACGAMPGARVRSVAGSSALDVWAVGIGGEAFHFDGTSWSSGCASPSGTLNAVWAAGPAEAWAVGENRTIVRWDGTGWNAMAPPYPGTAPFVSVWGSSPSDVWVLSREEVLHFDGHGWSRTTPGDMTTLGFDFGPFHELGGTGPADAWIATESGVIHWDGRGFWASLAAPAEQGNLFRSVWAGGPADVWVVGMNLDAGAGAVDHFDGRWAPEAAQGPALQSVRGASTGELFLQTDATLLRSNGGTVTDLETPAAPTGAPFIIAASDLFLPDALGVARWDGRSWARALLAPAP